MTKIRRLLDEKGNGNPMASDEPVEGRCNAEIDKEERQGYCLRYPTVDDDGEVINGKCPVHGGLSTGAPKGNTHAELHGLYTRRSTYYQKLLPREQMWLDLMIDTFLDDAPFDREHTGKMELLRQVVIDMHKVRRANDYIQKESIQKEQPVGVTDDGKPVLKDVEHDLNITVDRLEKSVIKRLKELGILDDPDTQIAESTATLAEVLASEDDPIDENQLNERMD